MAGSNSNNVRDWVIRIQVLNLLEGMLMVQRLQGNGLHKRGLRYSLVPIINTAKAGV